MTKEPLKGVSDICPIAVSGFKVPVHVSNDGVIASYHYTVRAYGNRELCETLDTRRYLVRSGPVPFLG